MADQDNPQNNRSQELCRRVVTTESFIAEAKEIYGDRYDYSKVVYKNRDHRVVVTCPIHGDFEIYAREHLDGKGCPKCEKGEKYLVKLREKFGDKFGLDEFVYHSSTLPITLICPVHGAFSRLPHQILNSSLGCPECANKLKEDAHMASVAKKEAIKKEKEEQEAKWLEQWERERTEREIEREKALKSFLAGREPDGFYSPFQIYQQKVDEHIDDIRYNAKWREPYRAPFRLSEEDAKKLCCYRDGDLFYRYPNEAPTDFIRQAFERDYAIFGRGFEETLSHRSCIVSFEGDDLIIQEESYEHELERLESIRPEKKTTSPKKTIVPKELPTDFVSIDFETLYSQRVSACSVGMVKYRGGKKVDQYYSLIRPPFNYPGKCGQILTWVHGISEEDVKNEKTFAELLPEIEAFVEGLPLVAHNASVEKCCIRDACAFYEIETKLKYNNILDTLSLSKEAEAKMGMEVEGQGTHSLDAVCRRFGVPVLNHHHAQEDAEMCGNLILKFCEILSDERFPETSSSLESMTPGIEKQSSKGGCLGIVIVGIILSSFIAIL